jgi:hypothetical protein
MKSKRIKIPIYNGTLVMIQVDNWDKVIKKYDQEITDSMDGVVFKHNHEYVVAYNHNPKPGIIAHEAVHLVNHIFIDKHMTLDPYNDEPQAYLTEWFVNTISDYFKSLN